jgi:mannose-6-phosphate isomerase-like protein (cupin superfamily)
MLAVEADRLGDELADRALSGRQRDWTQLAHRRGGYRRPVGWDVVQERDLEWEDRPAHEGQAPRHAAALTEPAQMTESRARMWRYPPHTRGRRHLDPDQEEVFVPLRGTLTMVLGEPWERVDVRPGGVVVVHPGTALQMRNETDEEILVFVYGAPTRHGNAEFLEDVEAV